MVLQLLELHERVERPVDLPHESRERQLAFHSATLQLIESSDPTGKVVAKVIMVVMLTVARRGRTRKAKY